MSEFAEYLSNLDGYKEKVNMPDNVPNGRYELQLANAELKISSNGRLMIARRHIANGGEFDGFPVFDNIVLDTDFGPKQFRKWVEALGYVVPEDPVEIEELVDTICAEKPVCTGSVKTKGEFSNVTILGRASSEDGGFAPSVQNVPPRPMAPARAATAPVGQTTAPPPVANAAPAPAQAPAAVRRVSARAVAPEASVTPPSKEQLLAFAIGQGFEVNQTMSEEDIKAAITSSGYQKALLTEEEVQLLTGLGAQLV